MHFQHSERSKELQERISHFMDEHIFPSEEIFAQQMEEFAKQGDRCIIEIRFGKFSLLEIYFDHSSSKFVIGLCNFFIHNYVKK